MGGAGNEGQRYSGGAGGCYPQLGIKQEVWASQFSKGYAKVQVVVPHRNALFSQVCHGGGLGYCEGEKLTHGSLFYREFGRLLL